VGLEGEVLAHKIQKNKENNLNMRWLRLLGSL